MFVKMRLILLLVNSARLLNTGLEEVDPISDESKVPADISPYIIDGFRSKKEMQSIDHAFVRCPREASFVNVLKNWKEAVLHKKDTGQKKPGNKRPTRCQAKKTFSCWIVGMLLLESSVHGTGRNL